MNPKSKKKETDRVETWVYIQCDILASKIHVKKNEERRLTYGDHQNAYFTHLQKIKKLWLLFVTAVCSFIEIRKYEYK